MAAGGRAVVLRWCVVTLGGPLVLPAGRGPLPGCGRAGAAPPYLTRLSVPPHRAPVTAVT
ncbi:MAG TPA: hypothetical protein VKA84_01850 [Gemmatimonadaceae bacterium]|nr:hypothetical protein [Gemmatimonadaceae bacterium]